jgi:hypothetical protein
MEETLVDDDGEHPPLRSDYRFVGGAFLPVAQAAHKRRPAL